MTGGTAEEAATTAATCSMNLVGEDLDMLDGVFEKNDKFRTFLLYCTHTYSVLPEF